MRVFQPEAGQVDDGIFIRHVIAILVGIEKQVGRVHHPHAIIIRSASAAARQGGGRDVQPIHKRLDLAK